MRLLLLAVVVGLVLAPSALAAEQGNESRVRRILPPGRQGRRLAVALPERDRVVDAEYDKTLKRGACTCGRATRARSPPGRCRRTAR